MPDDDDKKPKSFLDLFTTSMGEASDFLSALDGSKRSEPPAPDATATPRARVSGRVIDTHGEDVTDGPPPGAREWLAERIRHAVRVRPEAGHVLGLLLGEAAMPTAEALQLHERCTRRK